MIECRLEPTPRLGPLIIVGPSGVGSLAVAALLRLCVWACLPTPVSCNWSPCSGHGAGVHAPPSSTHFYRLCAPPRCHCATFEHGKEERRLSCMGRVYLKRADRTSGSMRLVRCCRDTECAATPWRGVAPACRCQHAAGCPKVQRFAAVEDVILAPASCGSSRAGRCAGCGAQLQA